jgi:hypothetical protein
LPEWKGKEDKMPDASEQVGPAEAALAVEKAVRRVSQQVLDTERRQQEQEQVNQFVLGLKQEYEKAKSALPTDDATRKNAPVFRGAVSYFPRALAAVATLSKVGNDKHNPGQPIHWSQDKSNDHADCLMRHLADAGTVDTDGCRHSVKVAWRALALLEIELQIIEGAIACHHPYVGWDNNAGEPVCKLCGYGLRSHAHRDP